MPPRRATKLRRKPAVTPDYDYRIDPERTVYIIGDFNEDLLRSVLPRIAELRFDNDKPVSIVINSDGGETDCLDAIKSALCVQGPDGSQSRVVTFVAGHAASAGAMLLALGDYAIAAPASWIHFHGIRTITDAAIRMEDASQMARRLAWDNRKIARHLASVMIARVMHRYTRLKSSIDQFVDPKGKKLSLVEKYVILARGKMYPAGEKVLRAALRNLMNAKELAERISKIKFPPKSTPADRDLGVLESIIELHRKKSGDPNWRLDEFNLSEILSDNFTFHTYTKGIYPPFLARIVNLYGVEFLDPAAFKKYRTLKGRKRQQFLLAQVKEDIGDFYQFTSSMADLLLYGENRLTAWDAYWVGAIDEIQGDDEHYGLRRLVERKRR